MFQVKRLGSDFEWRQFRRIYHLPNALNDALIPGQFDGRGHQQLKIVR
jgi:hypothetical protein